MKRYDIKTTDTETLRKWYYLMSLGRALDEKAPSYLLQSLGWSYHAPYAGHDGIQLAIGQVFHRGEDYLFPYYRDMLTVLSAGMTAEEIILNGISKATDPSSGGRHLRPQKGSDGQPQGSRQLLRLQEPAHHPLQRKRRFRLDERHDRSPRTCDQYA